MKKDVHFKIDEGLLLELDAMSSNEGLPAVRFIETALREFLDQAKNARKYRITAVNNITGIRHAISAAYKTRDDADHVLQRMRKLKDGIPQYYSRLQIERCTL